jgi:hypothetical protein
MGSMDAIRSHAARLPALDDRWTPGAVGHAELLEGLRSGAVAGPELSHPLDNVLGNIRLLYEGDPDKQFGMTGLRTVDPECVLIACGEAGDRFAEAIRRRDRVILATGHPVGLAHLYIEVGRLLRAGGARIVEPADGIMWQQVDRPRPWQIRYLDGVAMLTDKASARHTHSEDAMNRMLDDLTPDLVFADHGFAGAAIERGVDTVSIADVNDPALLVAQAQGRTRTVIVMDDNVAPQAYWPCFQAIAARLA